MANDLHDAEQTVFANIKKQKDMRKVNKISQETAYELLAALIETSTLFDNHPELPERGTYEVIHNAIRHACMEINA